jgi:hypothetical protein
MTEQTEQTEQPIELEYESDEDTITNDSESLQSIEIDDEMTGILYPHQLTLTIHLVQEADGSWTRTVS